MKPMNSGSSQSASPIRVENLYYLLSYAWGLLPVVAPVAGGSEAPPETLLDLLAVLLRDQLQQLVKRGLNQDYQAEELLTGMPRGKILLGRSMREQTMPRARLWCESDERTPDTRLNQLVKAAAYRLAEAGEVREELRQDLRGLLRFFDGVRLIPLLHVQLAAVRVYRHTARYSSVIHLSYLVRNLALPTQTTGTVLLPDIWRDERRMAVLFEKFVRNFYSLHLRGTATVRARGIKWRLEAVDERSAQHLPTMKTDVVVEYTQVKRVTLLECKFYPQVFTAEYRGRRRVRSAHLYQLFAYQQHLKQRFPGRELRSVLLYPVGEASELLRYKLDEEPLLVYTLNLNQDWQSIQNDMLGLLHTI